MATPIVTKFFPRGLSLARHFSQAFKFEEQTTPANADDILHSVSV
jgi:hypothetical protein